MPQCSQLLSQIQNFPHNLYFYWSYIKFGRERKRENMSFSCVLEIAANTRKLCCDDNKAIFILLSRKL